METIAVIIFIVTYAGVALGTIPGLALDRTGIALLGAIAMTVTAVLTTQQAVGAIHISTMLLLYSLMIISAQLRLSGFYTRLALYVTQYAKKPALFLFFLMGISAVLSSILANDIVCLAFTPVLCLSLMDAKINPVPFLIGLAVSSNIGSAATIIGNPQNIIIGQLGHLKFDRFIMFCLVPSLLSLISAFGIIYFLYKKKFNLQDSVQMVERRHNWPEFNKHQTIKGLVVVFLLVFLFFTPIAREISALILAGFLLCSRSMRTRTILGLVDWHLLTLFCGLFIVIAGIEATGATNAIMKFITDQGMNIQSPFNLVFLSSILSNIVSNVPAVMLIVRFLDVSNPVQWYTVALASTFAGNLITIGSIANLIVIEAAKGYGISISFKEHAKAGIPITIVSILITLLWIR